MGHIPNKNSATRSCGIRKRAVTPIYCENLDMLTHHYSLGLIYTHPARAGTRARPVAVAAFASCY